MIVDKHKCTIIWKQKDKPDLVREYPAEATWERVAAADEYYECKPGPEDLLRHAQILARMRAGTKRKGTI